MEPTHVRSNMPARLAVVLVNWNRKDDTIECLESLLRSTIPVRAVVVDNASADRSLDHIEAWAKGESPYEPPVGPLGRLSSPPLPKPVSHRRITADEARTRGLGGADLTLIDAGGNLGFAGGNNLGITAALLDPDIDYVWCLNNDTVVEPDACAALVAQMDATHRVGVCGTVVRYYHRPGYVQALNGSRFSLVTGASKGIGLGQPAARAYNPAQVIRDTDFVLGASCGVSRAFIETVGLMEESYFLYFEEIDWMVRNRGRFAVAFAHGSIIYHKEGGSIGSSGKKGARSETAEYYLLNSRLKFYRRNYPLLLPLQYVQALALIGRRLLRRQPRKAMVMAKAMLGMRR